MSKQGFAKVTIQGRKIISKEFDDIYYSCDDGRAESEYVFLQGNKLPGAWQQRRQYCIVETGFGSGLNFLTTLEAWISDPDHCRTLDYYAIEGFPLHASQLETLYTYWPDLALHADALIRQYPPVSHGIHSLAFANGQVRLHLIFSEIGDALNEIELQADCWFMDGFAPSKNPSMWRPEVLKKIAQISQPGASLATFTAAGAVRRGLLSAGFEVVKRKGFGRKREMLCAAKKQLEPCEPESNNVRLPWFQPARTERFPQKVAVIGAGIAGAQMAYHLAQQGIHVTVFEAQHTITSGASGNQAGILAPKLNARPDTEEAFYLAAFLYQLRQISTLQNQGLSPGFEQHGLLRIAHNAARLKHLQQLQMRQDLPSSVLEIMSAQQLSEICAEPIAHPGIMIGLAGALAPDSLCKALLSHPGITLHCGQRVQQILTHETRPGIRLGSGQEKQFDGLVLTNGFQANEFSGAIDIIPVRGQTSGASLLQNRTLKQAIDHEGYILKQPGHNSEVILGASHVRSDCEAILRPQESRANLTMLAQHCTKLATQLCDLRDSHAGIRATTADRLPIVGALPDAEFYRKAYADLHFGKSNKSYPPARYHHGVYVLTGLGSRGLCSAAYCANILSHIMTGRPPPVSKAQLQALHPARFMIRALKKRAPF